MAEEKKEWLPAWDWYDTAEENDAKDALRDWLKRATRPVYYPPDRRRVRKELRDHIDERTEGLQNRGMGLGDARRKVLEMMGDPAETGSLLRQVHKPWLGWMLCITRIAFVLLVIVAVALIKRDSDLFMSTNQVLEKYLWSDETKYNSTYENYYRLEPGLSYGQLLEKYGVFFEDGQKYLPPLTFETVKTVLAERSWHCDEKVRFGAFTVRCEEFFDQKVAWKESCPEFQRVFDSGTYERCCLLLRFTGTLGDRMPLKMYNRIEMVDNNGTEYSEYSYYDSEKSVSFSVISEQTSPWGGVVVITFLDPPEAKWLEVSLGSDEEAPKLRIWLDEWQTVESNGEEAAQP